jgi:hypothetical protein
LDIVEESTIVQVKGTADSIRAEDVGTLVTLRSFASQKKKNGILGWLGTLTENLPDP